MKIALLVFQKIEKRMYYIEVTYERNPVIIPMVIIIVGIMSARIMSMRITGPIKMIESTKHVRKAFGLL